MLTYSKLNLLLGCFNQFVFSDAKMNIDLLKLYYKQDAFNKNNTLIDKLLTILEGYKFTDITEGLFISAIQSDGKSDSEVTDIVDRIKEYKTYNKDQSKVFRDDLKEVCYQAYMTRAKIKYPEDVVAFTEELKKFSYKTNVSNNLIVKNFQELDITDLAHTYSGEGYKSSFKFINDSFTCGGYIPGQIVTVTASPGCFHGDTEVLTLDGKTKTLRQISEDKGDYLGVYSCDHLGNSKVSRASDCQITKYVDHWVVVNIDGTDIRCTDDHEFMLIDGTYKAAIDLVPGDSLMPLLRKSDQYEDSITVVGSYELITCRNDNWNYTHRYVREYLVGTGDWVVDPDIKYQVHHSRQDDKGRFIRSDNRFSSLRLLSESDHMSLHCSHRWELDPEGQKAQLLEAGTNTRITSERIRAQNFKNWQREDYRSYMASVSSRNGKKVTQTRNAVAPGYNGQLTKVLGVQKCIKSLIDRGLIKCASDITSSIYDSNRPELRTPSFKSALRYYNDDLDRMFSDGQSYHNHVVRSVTIEKCDGLEPAYDMVNVDIYHNYAIAAGDGGVIVHNCGKSLFVQNEVVNFIKQGKRVHMLIMGDLNELDMAIRLTCMMARKPKRVIESDIINYYEMYKGKFSDQLGITVVPSGSVSSREYVDWMLDRADEYDVLVVDYDANHKRERASSSYDEFGIMYDSYTELSRLGKLLFVCAQPKIQYYREEFLPLEAIGESSRKQQIVDLSITLGKRYESKMRMGSMQIVKSRRGELTSAKWIGTSEGLFYECSNILYGRFQNQSEYIGLYTYDELENMDVLADVFSPDGENTVVGSNPPTSV